MEKIIIAIFLVFFLLVSIYLIINLKREGSYIIRHFVDKKQIAKPHKFSEWEKCNICLNCYKKKSIIESVKKSLELSEYPRISDEKYNEWENNAKRYRNWKMNEPLVVRGKVLDVGVIFDCSWKPNISNFYEFSCTKCRGLVCQFALKDGEEKLVDVNRILSFLKKHQQNYHE